MSNTHSKYSPSSSSRWLTCTQSLVIPPRGGKGSSAYAKKGTALHSLCDDLLSGREAQLYYGDYVPTVKDMETIVKPYIDYVEHISGDLRLFEQSVAVNEDCFGTADAVIYDSSARTLNVIDLKCGEGIFVSVKNNTQLQIYALGAVKKLFAMGKSIETVLVHVAQPLKENFEKESVKLKDLLALDKQIQKVIEEVNNDQGKYVPSESNCRWCPHVSYCPEILRQAQKAAFEVFTHVPLNERLDMIPALKVFIKSTEDESMAKLMSGEIIESYSLSPGRKSRSWVDEKAAYEILWPILGAAKVIETKSEMLSVAKIEKEIKAQKINFDLSELIKSEATTVVITKNKPK